MAALRFENSDKGIARNSDVSSLRSRPLVLLCLLALALGATLAWGRGELKAAQIRVEPVEYILPAVRNSEQTGTVSALREPSKYKRLRQVDLTAINADAIYAFNPLSFQMYAKQNIDEKLQIASITKLVTTAVILEEFELDETIEIRGPLLHDVTLSTQLVEGNTLTVEDALNAMLVRSINDVAMSFARNYPEGYDTFVDKMNEKAARLGMGDSHFTNPAGYDHPDNYSTASDLRKLAVYAINDPFISKTVSQSSANIKVIRLSGVEVSLNLSSTNKLFGLIDGIKGVKTGQTLGAGGCFISYIETQEGELVTIILGADGDRFHETEELIKVVNQAREASP